MYKYRVFFLNCVIWSELKKNVLQTIICLLSFGLMSCNSPTSPVTRESSVFLRSNDDTEIRTHEIIHLADQSVMVFIPASEFVMGRDGMPAELGESPAHSVHLDGFYIDKFEVTNARYQHFMNKTGVPPPDFWGAMGTMNGPDLPVSWVTWFQAEAYCQWVSKRLPTEAEWEKAARGTDERLYPWGNKFNWNYGNFSDNHLEDGHIDGFSSSSPVGYFLTDMSPYGVFDMGGNVLEWVADWEDENYYSISPKENPKGPVTGTHKVVRGGAMDIGPEYSHAAYRNRLLPHLTNMTFGFR